MSTGELQKMNKTSNYLYTRHFTEVGKKKIEI